MQQKLSTILIGFILCLNTFYGCASLQKEHIKKQYFDLNINPRISGKNNINSGAVLLVKGFTINPALDSHSLVYRVGENEYINDYYNEFINYPAKLVTEEITETLYSSVHFRPGLSNMKHDIQYRLSGKITRLYGDFQDTNNPEAIIEIKMILEQKTDKTFRVISNKTYLSRTPVSSSRPAQLIQGWSNGLSKIITQFISDFALLYR